MLKGLTSRLTVFLPTMQLSKHYFSKSKLAQNCQTAAQNEERRFIVKSHSAWGKK